MTRRFRAGRLGASFWAAIHIASSTFANVNAQSTGHIPAQVISTEIGAGVTSQQAEATGNELDVSTGTESRRGGAAEQTTVLSEARALEMERSLTESRHRVNALIDARLDRMDKRLRTVEGSLGAQRVPQDRLVFVEAAIKALEKGESQDEIKKKLGDWDGQSAIKARMDGLDDRDTWLYGLGIAILLATVGLYPTLTFRKGQIIDELDRRLRDVEIELHVRERVDRQQQAQITQTKARRLIDGR